MSFKEKLFAKKVAYKIVSVLKNKEAAKVYKALRGPLPFQQEVILKIFPPGSPLFTLEWESLHLAAPLSCCAKLLSVESFKGQKALVLEYIKGATLWDLMQHYKLSSKEIKYLMNQIYKGLKELNSQNLFHGDLSLTNILITARGEVRFIDFGKGNRRTQGTLPFTAPEILKGGGCHLKSDLFSLGVIEFFLKNPHKLHSLKNKRAEFFITNGPLLQADPMKRHFPENLNLNQIICPISLTHKLEELIHLKNSHCQTKDSPEDYFTGFPFKRIVFLVGSWLFLSFTLNSMPSNQWITKEGFLKIHTSQWFYITLNSFKGYTPVQIPLSSGHHKLLWQSYNKKGEKHLYIPEGKTILLNDKDFLH